MKPSTLKCVILFLTLVLSLPGITQGTKVEMADVMRENGRIYVVVAVLLTILAGIILYLIRIDRKISRLEKNK